MDITALAAWRKILKYYRKNNVQMLIEKMRGTAGEAYFGVDIIKLDPREDILSTMCHELVHLAYPEMPEEDVICIEKKLMKKLSRRQFIFLIRILHNRTTGTR